MTDFARILPATILVAVSCLFFACNDAGQEGGAAGATTSETAVPAATSGLSIVFVKVDSLQAGYTEVATELARLEENFLKAQENHNKRVNALQSEVQKLQNQMQQGLLAPNRVQSEQQRIGQKEQEIMQQRELAINSIQEDQLRIQQRFSERVKVVLEEIQEEKGYDFILNQGQNSAVLITNDKYDITNMVLERLNAASGQETGDEGTGDDETK